MADVLSVMFSCGMLVRVRHLYRLLNVRFEKCAV